MAALPAQKYGDGNIVLLKQSNVPKISCVTRYLSVVLFSKLYPALLVFITKIALTFWMIGWRRQLFVQKKLYYSAPNVCLGLCITGDNSWFCVYWTSFQTIAVAALSSCDEHGFYHHSICISISRLVQAGMCWTLISWSKAHTGLFCLPNGAIPLLVFQPSRHTRKPHFSFPTFWKPLSYFIEKRNNTCYNYNQTNSILLHFHAGLYGIWIS